MSALIPTSNGCRRVLAFLLCLYISQLPLLFAQQGNALKRGRVGLITGLSGSVTQNAVPIRMNTAVHWNDVLRTDQSARVRIRFDDGSTLNAGSLADVKILGPGAAGPVAIQLLKGHVRVRVSKPSGGRAEFQLTTPHSTLEVIGTDFFAEVNQARTQVIVYSGIVRAKALHSAGSKNIAAGQTVEINAFDISALQLISDDMERDSLAQTALPDEMQPSTVSPAAAVVAPVERRSQVRRNVLIGLGIAAVAGVALGLRAGGGGQKQTPAQQEPNPPSIPAR